jgi:hypothetical protein
MRAYKSKSEFDLDSLLHPAQAFRHPLDVVNDPDMTLNEKRAILASWASDACAIEAAPSMRASPGGEPVNFDDIMDALRALDRQSSDSEALPPWRRVLRRQRLFGRGRGGRTEQGSPLQ